MIERNRARGSTRRTVERSQTGAAYASVRKVKRHGPFMTTHVQSHQNRRVSALAQEREDVWIILVHVLLGAIAQCRFRLAQRQQTLVCIENRFRVFAFRFDVVLGSTGLN